MAHRGTDAGGITADTHRRLKTRSFHRPRVVFVKARPELRCSLQARRKHRSHPKKTRGDLDGKVDRCPTRR